MKTLVFHRGGAKNPYTCANGDKYDSTATLFDGYSQIYYSELWNTDHTEGYKGGRLARGVYHGIVGPRAKDGRLVIKLFRCTPEELAKLDDSNELTEAMLTLPSEIPNPNHGSQLIIGHVQVHGGGINWDWSRGCLTGLNTMGYHEFDKLMNLLKTHEKLNVILL